MLSLYASCLMLLLLALFVVVRPAICLLSLSLSNLILSPNTTWFLYAALTYMMLTIAQDFSRVLYTRIPDIPPDGAFFATFPAKDGMEFHTEIGNRKSCSGCFPLQGHSAIWRLWCRSGKRGGLVNAVNPRRHRPFGILPRHKGGGGLVRPPLPFRP